MTGKKYESHARDAQERGRQAPSLPSSAIPITVAVVVLVLIAGFVVSGSSQWSRLAAESGDVAAPVATARARATRALPYPDVPRITLQETLDALARGRAVLVDVRSRSSYDRAHMTGALSFPEDEIQARLHELPADKDLILYCT